MKELLSVDDKKYQEILQLYIPVIKEIYGDKNCKSSLKSQETHAELTTKVGIL